MYMSTGCTRKVAGCDEAKDAEEAMTNEHAATSAVTSLMAEQCDG